MVLWGSAGVLAQRIDDRGLKAKRLAQPKVRHGQRAAFFVDQLPVTTESLGDEKSWCGSSRAYWVSCSRGRKLF